MTITSAQFKMNFPEFGNAKAYPDPTIDFWLGIAYKLNNNPRRWGDMLDYGVQLFVAHHLALSRKSTTEAKVGNIPGLNSGPISGQSIDKVSEQYSVSDAANEKAGHWNLTTYGTRYWQLANMAGMGPVQIS